MNQTPKSHTQSVSTINTRSKTNNAPPSNTDIMNVLSTVQATQSAILASNTKLADNQSAQFAELNRSMEILTKQVSELKLENSTIRDKLNSLETRLTASEKILSKNTQSPLPSSPNTPSLIDITHEIQLRNQCARNIIIRGAPESLDSQAHKRVEDDINLVHDIFQKLEPQVPQTSICKAFRIGKNVNTKPRLLKVVLLSHDDPNRVIVPFLRLRTTSPEQFANISISRDRTLLERQSIREIYNELRTRQDHGESNISIRYTDGFPRIVPATNLTHLKNRQLSTTHSKN